MRREGRLHGYEFDREEPHKRVKACNQPTNRSKFRSKYPQEKAGRPRSKALKKMKGQRNKAHASDVASNHKMHEWALRHTRCATLLADSLEEADLDPSQHAPLLDALKVLLLSDHLIRTLPPTQQEDITTLEDGDEENDDKDSTGSDWLDLGSTDGSEDDWFLC